MAPKIHIFPYSNFCEKTVWALEALDQPYAVQTHYPGPHARAIKRLSGQTAVPVMEHAGQVTPGSAAIIDRFAKSPAYAALVPEPCREEAMAWQARLDAVGGTFRGTLFHSLLPDRSLAIRILSGGKKSAWGGYGLFFRAFTPVLMSMLRKEIPTQKDGIARCLPVLDDIAAAAGDGYLVGGQFTLADLTAAAMFYPLCHPSGCLGHAVAADEPGLDPWHAIWADHPARAYVARIYRDHRHPIAP